MAHLTESVVGGTCNVPLPTGAGAKLLQGRLQALDLFAVAGEVALSE